MDTKWFNEKNDIVIDTLPELVAVANTPQFGESERETLPTFLMCQAFECRFDPEMARTFRLAAMIISRLPDNAELCGGTSATNAQLAATSTTEKP